MRNKIYKVLNKINGKVYIGLTKSSPMVRWKQHLKIAHNIKHYELKKKAYPFHRAIAKYGENNFEISTIEECETLEIAQEKEKFWIKEYNSTNMNNGYNLCKGGEGVLHTPQVKENHLKGILKARDEGRLHNSILNKEQALEIKKIHYKWRNYK